MRSINIENEKNFENRKASGEKVRASQSRYYWATALTIDKHKEQTYEAIKGKNILEIGCASGNDAIDYCKFANNYIGIDIADVAIKNCNKLSLSNAKFYCIDGHELPFKDKSFDCVIVNSLLHHLDLSTSFKEISRVLNENGVLIFREPLGINPAFQIYRILTPEARTDDERPFTLSDLKLMKNYFDLTGTVQWFGFLSILSAFVKNNTVRDILLG